MRLKSDFFALSPDRVFTKQEQARSNRKITLAELYKELQSDFLKPEVYDQLPELAAAAYNLNDAKAAKALREKKSELPYFLASGYCPKHHSNETLVYNGVLQIDIDFKVPGGDKLAADVCERV